MSKRDDYVDTLKAQLDQWNADMAKLEARSREAQAGARTEFDKHLEALRQQREQAMYQLNLLQTAAGDAWQELMRGTDEAWARMREAIDKASSHFRAK
jgi:hypothetical protein